MNPTLSVAALLVLLAAACSGDPVQGEKCPGPCPFLFAPVCGAQWFDRFETFPNDCVRRSRNCHSSETFEFVCNGTCVYEQGRAEPKRCEPLQPASLCKKPSPVLVG